MKRLILLSLAGLLLFAIPHGALIGGAVLNAFGLLSLAGQVFRNLNWGFLWHFIVIGIGAMCMAGVTK